MIIKRVDIHNFRGFEHLEAKFHPQMTVVIGNNTAGKTTLLQAVQVGLGAFLQSLSDLPTGKAYRKNFAQTDQFLRYSLEKRDFFPNNENTRLDIVADFVTTKQNANGNWDFPLEEITWYRELQKGHTSHTRQCAGQLIDKVREMELERKTPNSNAVFPLVLSFGTNRIDAQYRTAKKTKERLTRVAKAYKSALQQEVDFQGALEWLKRYRQLIKDGKEFEGTWSAFFEALQTAIPALSEITFVDNEIEAYVTVYGRQPERHTYTYMSDGLKAMINIVSEIAHRCIELNGFLGTDAIKKTPGVVVIDEIDLYLHPRWQRHVLRDLQNAFPKIQFIVSTHSPFIVQSLESNQLISFDDAVNVSGEPFREGLEDIAEERMGLKQDIRSKRFNEMVEKATQLFNAVDQQSTNADELKKQLDILEAEYSDDPAYLAMVRMEYQSKLDKR